MVNTPRRKGTTAESAVVDWFHKQGESQVERHALHGVNDLGDLQGVPGCVISVKHVGRDTPMRLSTWLNELEGMVVNSIRRHPEAPEPHGLLVVRRAGYPSPANWYAVSTLREWWEIYRRVP